MFIEVKIVKSKCQSFIESINLIEKISSTLCGKVFVEIVIDYVESSISRENENQNREF